MAASAEHQFISQTLDRTISHFSGSRLFGVSEASRGTFDYACILHRDFVRPLVSQVLWRNTRGIDKDLRTLLHDKESMVKLYFVADTVPTRTRLDEILSSYRSNERTKSLLRGLKLIFVPPCFDADKEVDRTWMADYLSNCVLNDLFLRVLFGQLTAFEYKVFVNHGGPLGLKYAILHEISENGLYHNPSFKERLGYKTDGPLREAIAMLGALGLIQRIDRSMCHVPTIKGRFILDLARLLISEATTQEDWSDETTLMFQLLGISRMPECEVPKIERGELPTNLVTLDLMAISACCGLFGRTLVRSGKGEGTSGFYSLFDWNKFANPQEVPEDYTRWFRDNWFRDD